MENNTTEIVDNKVVSEKRKAGKMQILKSWKVLGGHLIGSGLVSQKDEQVFRDLYLKAKKQYEGEDIF